MRSQSSKQNDDKKGLHTMSEITTKQPAPTKTLPAKAGPFLILAAALLWSLAGLLVKYIPWHPLAIASARSLLAALVFVAAYRQRLLRRFNWTTLISGLALMLTQTGFIIANKMTTAANAIMLQYASPLFVVIFGAIFYHYRPTRRETIALGLALAGIILFFLDDLSPGSLLGNLIATGTGVTFGLVFLLNSRPECDTPLSIFIGQVATFLIGLPMLLQVRDVTAPSILAILILGFFQLGLAYFLFGIGIRLTRPLSANLLALLEPIANPVWVFLVLGEVPGYLAGLGAVIVLGSILYLNLERLRQPVSP